MRGCEWVCWAQQKVLDAETDEIEMLLENTWWTYLVMINRVAKKKATALGIDDLRYDKHP